MEKAFSLSQVAEDDTNTSVSSSHGPTSAGDACPDKKECNRTTNVLMVIFFVHFLWPDFFFDAGIHKLFLHYV